MKKILSLVLAVMMIAVMGLAFADPTTADMTGEAGRIGEFEPADSATIYTNTIKIYKEITAYNPEGSDVNAPTVTFTYEIVAGDKDKAITDYKTRHDPENSASVVTKAGVGTPTITNVVLTPATSLKTSANGTANRFPITVDFSNVDFKVNGTGAGVYRYKINETITETAKNAAGIKEGNVANSLYMDVYVDGDGAIYGYVLFTNNVDIDCSVSEAPAATTAGKTEGFVGSKGDKENYAAETDSAADKYYTFDLEITKIVENDTYTKSTHHQFPFTVTLDNSTVTAKVLPIMTVGTNATQTALATDGIVIGTNDNKTTWTPTIADSATVKYVGIPVGTTVTVKEKNNVVGTSYTSVSTNAETNAASKVINYDDDSNIATVSCTTALTKATENHTNTAGKMVTFTNTLLQISPTGYVARIAPYALILIAGIALLIVAMKRRPVKEED